MFLSNGGYMKGHSSIKRAERGTPTRHRLHVGLFVALAALAVGNAVHAQQRNVALTPQDYSITAGSLGDALNQLATQSKLQIVYSPELVDGKTAPAISGQQTWREALQKLLAGSGLEWGLVNDTTVVIRRSGNSSKPTRAKPAASAREQTQKPGQKPETTTLPSVTVTGTRIRGGSTPSPVITIGSEQIAEEGFSDLGEVIRNIPQNFSGGQNPGVMTSANISGNNFNDTGGSGLNLRGLGTDATLTLLNGRRMSYTGAAQAVDISTIPVEALEQLEIVPDGASAIYGSDAVGGVANVILKRDFEGMTVGVRYGEATDGGLATREYRANAGTVWSTGGLMVAGMKASNDPIYSNQRDYTQSMYRPSTLWQRNDLRSGLLSLHQSLGDSIELRLDALRSERAIMTDTGYSGMYYLDTPETKTTLVSPSLEWQLANDWLLTVSAAFGKDTTHSPQKVIDTETDAVSINTIQYGNKSRSYEIGAEGPLFTLPGGDVRLAAGAGYRSNGLRILGDSHTTVLDGDEGSRFGYAELSVPVIGPEQGWRGARHLALTGAIRTEDYRTYGRVTTPKFGLIYSPGDDFTLKTSWGKSFKAPRLLQRYSAQNVFYFPQATLGGAGDPADATVLFRGGGSEDLRPERARTWSASLAFHPDALPGLESELTWFDIDYADRIVQPIVVYQALANPIYAGFVDYHPSPEALAQAINDSDSFRNYAGVPYDASKVAAIVDGRYVNATRQRLKGVDLSGSYRSDLGEGHLTIRGSASWLDSTQATIPTQSPYDLSGTLFNPARLSGRIGAIWTRGGLSASVFGNYKSGVKNTVDGRNGASFTTFDGTLRYGTGEGNGFFANTVFELAAQNLLNRAPPLYGVVGLNEAPYDSTNYSAVGRFVSIYVSKHW
jgi:outer membrane receptor protein involved in Fe transport